MLTLIQLLKRQCAISTQLQLWREKSRRINASKISWQLGQKLRRDMPIGKWSVWLSNSSAAKDSLKIRLNLLPRLSTKTLHSSTSFWPRKSGATSRKTLTRRWKTSHRTIIIGICLTTCLKTRSKASSQNACSRWTSVVVKTCCRQSSTTRSLRTKREAYNSPRDSNRETGLSISTTSVSPRQKGLVSNPEIARDQWFPR